MLQFDQSFFEGEIREGFYIEPMMKRAWAVEIEVLSQVAKVCDKYQIPWFATYGTLLGAVRHQGFIPWDDDIDILVKRKDYEKILKILPNELPDGYVVDSYYTAPDHEQPWSAVMNTKHILADKEKIEQYYGCPYICGIDIYPLDYIPDDRSERELQREMFGIVWSVARAFNEHLESGELYRYVEEIEKMCGVTLHDDGTLRQQIYLLADRIAGMYGEEECRECTIMRGSWARQDPNFTFPKGWYENTIKLPFENMEVSASSMCHEELKKLFGENYMTPIRGAQGHDYPFYRRQQEYLDANGIHLDLK